VPRCVPVTCRGPSRITRRPPRRTRLPLGRSHRSEPGPLRRFVAPGLPGPPCPPGRPRRPRCPLPGTAPHHRAAVPRAPRPQSRATARARRRAPARGSRAHRGITRATRARRANRPAAPGLASGASPRQMLRPPRPADHPRPASPPDRPRPAGLASRAGRPGPGRPGTASRARRPAAHRASRQEAGAGGRPNASGYVGAGHTDADRPARAPGSAGFRLGQEAAAARRTPRTH
jgi:hypothetical protein